MRRSTDRLELARRQAWDALSKRCTDADMDSLLRLAQLIGESTPQGAQHWLMRIAKDAESSDRIVTLICTAIAELRIRRDEIRQTVEGN